MTRLATAWRALEPEQRLAALAALALFASMFLPWYSKTDTVVVRGVPKATATSLSAFQAFSFVEAAVLLVSASVLWMLFARAERRDFQLPGGDGLILMLAGGWCALLIFYRLLDKPSLQGNARVTATVGVEWGIFGALLAALGLLYAGRRMRALQAPEPPLRRTRDTRPRRSAEPQIAGEPRVRRQAGGAAHDPAGADPSGAREEETAVTVVTGARAARTPRPERHERAPARGRARYPPAPPAPPANGEQLSFEDPPARRQQ